MRGGMVGWVCIAGVGDVEVVVVMTLVVAAWGE